MLVYEGESNEEFNAQFVDGAAESEERYNEHVR